jgi:tetratricopeptide (TPR) repeat protein
MSRKQSNFPDGQASPAISMAEQDYLFREGVKHHQAGRLAGAKLCFHQVLTINPIHSDALQLLGIIALEEKDPDLAVELMKQAVNLNRNNPFYFSNLGVALKNQGRLDEAIAAYRQAIDLKRDYAEAHSNLGTALRSQGKLDEAVASFRVAVELNPNFAKAHFSLGVALNDMKNFDDALLSFDKAISLRSDHFEAILSRGNSLQGLERSAEALASYDSALAIQPEHAGIHHNRGSALKSLGRQEEALESYRTALKLDPNYTDAHFSLGSALQELNRLDEAVLSFDNAISLKPDYFEAYLNRGILLHDLARYSEALANYDQVVALKPDYAGAFNNRGNTLKALRRFDEALASYGKAQTLEPDGADAHWNEAILRLLTGDFERGWIKSEWRLKSNSLGMRKRHFEQPTWLGEESVDGKTILVHTDQGFGDTIQFCRYVPLLAGLGARVIIEAEEPLHQLLASLAGLSGCVSKGEIAPHFDMQCPMLSLPLAFGTRIGSMPCSIPYLSTSPTKLRLLEAQLWPKHRPRIGVVWSGSPKHQNDRNRSIPLDTFAPVFDVAATFVSLQKDLRADDRVVLAGHHDILNFGPSMESFDDTAALISQLDLVISVDTSVAHLAGALGIPVWIMLPFDPDWRWLFDRDDSPWYPTARLFRQPNHRDWSSVVHRVQDALRQFVRWQHTA